MLLMSVIVLSRIHEILLSRKNELIIVDKHKAKLASSWEHYLIYGFHFCWFISLTLESIYKKEVSTGIEALLIYFILTISQILRIESMSSLGDYWTAKIYKIPGQKICFQGIYRFMAHPCYLAVSLEFFALPYLFHAYWTILIFFPLNLILIANRIRLEKKITGRLWT